MTFDTVETSHLKWFTWSGCGLSDYDIDDLQVPWIPRNEISSRPTWHRLRRVWRWSTCIPSEASSQWVQDHPKERHVNLICEQIVTYLNHNSVALLFIFYLNVFARWSIFDDMFKFSKFSESLRALFGCSDDLYALFLFIKLESFNDTRNAIF